MNCRQNWSEKNEVELNKQIGREYHASLAYHVLSNYFNRDDVGLNKLVDYFNKASLEERGHADKLMNYQKITCSNVYALLMLRRCHDSCISHTLESFDIDH